jgi:hypothetical protein
LFHEWINIIREIFERYPIPLPFGHCSIGNFQPQLALPSEWKDPTSTSTISSKHPPSDACYILLPMIDYNMPLAHMAGSATSQVQRRSLVVAFTLLTPNEYSSSSSRASALPSNSISALLARILADFSTSEQHPVQLTTSSSLQLQLPILLAAGAANDLLLWHRSDDDKQTEHKQEENCYYILPVKVSAFPGSDSYIGRTAHTTRQLAVYALYEDNDECLDQGNETSEYKNNANNANDGRLRLYGTVMLMPPT